MYRNPLSQVHPEPEEQADRLIIQADSLRRVAEDLERRAAEIRPSREPLNHRSVFRQLVERDHGGDPERAACRYCRVPVHPFDPLHRESCPVGRCAHIDHLVPVRSGGRNVLDDLVIACAPCNLAKGARTVIEWQMALLCEIGVDVVYVDAIDDDWLHQYAIAQHLVLISAAGTAYPRGDPDLTFLIKVLARHRQRPGCMAPALEPF